jgi:UDP-N-acetylglucosamine 2-epimerase (non-hydrolysing)
METQSSYSSLDFLISTRREAMHLAPVIHAFRKLSGAKTRLVSLQSSQKDLNEVLHSLSLRADIQWGIRGTEPNSGTYLGEINMLMSELWSRGKPDWLISFGHEDIAFAVSSAAFQNKIPIAHIEDINHLPKAWFSSPHIQRSHKSISILSDLLFTSSVQARNRLVHDGVKEEFIFSVGSTIRESGTIILENLCANEQLATLSRDCSDATRQRISAGRFILVDIQNPESVNRFVEVLPSVMEENPDMTPIFQSNNNIVFESISRHPLFRDSSKIFKPKHMQRCALIYKSACVMTDNDDVLEECSAFDTKGILLADNTDRVDIISSGSASIAAIRAELLARQIRAIVNERSSQKEKTGGSPGGQYPTAAKIVEAITSRTGEIARKERRELLSRQAG